MCVAIDSTRTYIETLQRKGVISTQVKVNASKTQLFFNQEMKQFQNTDLRIFHQNFFKKYISNNFFSAFRKNLTFTYSRYETVSKYHFAPKCF